MPAAEGSVHEAMNLAGVWKLLILFVCENNCWAGAQRPEEHCATPHIFLRAKGYNMPGQRVDLALGPAVSTPTTLNPGSHTALA
ncbi:thiamine pyrophosphate-dependent enzyme [Desulfobacula sp.]